MASDTVRRLREGGEDVPMNEILATTLFTLASSTTLLGVALVVTGKLKLASFVQYLPMPVVGGYLAYIGFYCLEAGLSTMSNKTIKDPADWVQLADVDSIARCLPGVAAGVGIFFTLSRYEHVAVLPGCLFVLLIVFYTLLLVTGSSLQDARDHGWVSPLPAAPQSLRDIYGYYDFSAVSFRYLTAQLPTWVAMYFVVAFSSSLDVAAVEMALGKPLNHNTELETVGLSNFVSGLTGGFTGSYIFSQTIFTMRGQLESRVTGLLVFLLEVTLVLCPFSVIAYVPKIFFGALQTLIACDLMVEWMWHARRKMLMREYAIVWLTFLTMAFTNLEIGIVVGIVIAGINFICSYVGASSVRRVMKRSRVERDVRERALLAQARLAIVTLELDGFIFFGSSVKMMDAVRRHVLVDSTTAELSSLSPTVNGHGRDDEDDSLRTLEADFGDDSAPTPSFSATPRTPAGAPPLHAQRTRFFILDFERVRGVDATAVRSCFNATKQLLAQHGIPLVFASVPPAVERLLREHNVLTGGKNEEGEHDDDGLDGSLVFESVDKALEWCEDELLVEEGIVPQGEAHDESDESEDEQEYDPADKKQMLHLLDELLPTLSAPEQQRSAALTLELAAQYVVPATKRDGDVLYAAGSATSGIFFIGSGKVDVFMPTKLHEGLGPGFFGRKRILRVCRGGIVGASEMLLHARHQFTAQAKARCCVFFLARDKYERMQREHPLLAARFQHAMLQSMAIGVLESNISDD
jgi:SulP family sulfate permease